VNHRDRALAALRGEPVDHIPFIARMELWHNYHRRLGTLPHPYERASLWDMQRDLGIGIMGFGAWDIPFYRLEHRRVQVSHATEGGTTVTRYDTPCGALTCRDVMAAELHDAAGSGARVEYPFKSEADYDALQFLIEDAEVRDNFEAYGAFVDAIGTDGLALPQAGHLPAHQLMIKHMGYERFYLELNDRPARIEALIQALTAQYRRILELAAASPAQAIEAGGNYDEHMTPPRVFDALFAPLYREARQVLSAAGKVLVVHGDGEMDVLLRKLMECGVQAVEALTPRPMTRIDLAAARRLWRGRVALWGGLPSTVLTPTYSEDEYGAFLERLWTDVAPGDRFILGFGDNVPTDALFPRILRLVAFWRERGSYPIR
jgi:uroporphyrinogen-III decarboxylase